MRPNNPNEKYPIGIDTVCPICGKRTCICLTEEEYAKYCDWKDRRILIQDALPGLRPPQREMLMSGICDECFRSFLYAE